MLGNSLLPFHVEIGTCARKLFRRPWFDSFLCFLLLRKLSKSHITHPLTPSISQPHWGWHQWKWSLKHMRNAFWCQCCNHQEASNGNWFKSIPYKSQPVIARVLRSVQTLCESAATCNRQFSNHLQQPSPLRQSQQLVASVNEALEVENCPLNL